MSSSTEKGVYRILHLIRLLNSTPRRKASQLMHIYENVLSNYAINFNKLFSYAKRREREQNIKQFMTNHMYHLVKDISNDRRTLFYE